MKRGLQRRMLVIACALLILGPVAHAAPTVPLIISSPTADGGHAYGVPVETLLFMSMLVLLPAALLMMSAFTRIVIVLALLRQALGTVQVPSNQILIGLSLFLTLFVMAPVLSKLNNKSLQPLLAQKIGFSVAAKRAETPIRKFMMGQTRRSDLHLFLRLDRRSQEKGMRSGPIPMMALIPAFITSELKTAFQIGFLLFIPFLIIDMVVAAVLMSLGMMMLSPVTISLPFKLMLFVLVNGWALTIGSLIGSFHHL